MTIQQNTDSKLLADWRQGDQTAFTILFERYFNKLLQFTNKKMGDRGLAEELVMDVLMRLWQRRDVLDTNDSLSPYLFQSVKNAIIDQFRKKAIETCLLDENLTIGLQDMTFEEHPYHIKELRQIYLKSLENLSPQRKRVFELSRLEGKSHREISLELNLSVSTVKQHINASLHTLRESMQPHTDIALTAITLFCIVNRYR